MATKLGKILADFSTSLSTDIAVGGTTATLSIATDDDSVALPSGRYFFTLDGGNSSKEHISCDLVGTALTNIKSLSRQGVETTGCARKHRIGTSVSLTDFGHIKFINDLVAGTTQLNASAPLGYDDAPASLTGNQLATVTYVLGVVNGGTVTFDQQVVSSQISGEALAVNDIVYLKESDAKWYKADADLVATFNQLQLGVCKTLAAGADVTIQVAISGPVSAFSGLTAGSKYYLSNTAGAISATEGTNSVFVGWALTTTILLFTPEKLGALTGSQGVPTANNAFVTEDNTSSSSTDQTQTTQDGSVEVGEADATSKKNKIAQSFIPTKTKIRGVRLSKQADTGTFTGTVTVALQADSSGSPSGSALASKTITNAEWSQITNDTVTEILFSSEYTSIVANQLYWIVISTSTADNSNHPNFGTNVAGGYANGSVKYNNTTDAWVAIATIDLYFETLEGNTNQMIKSNQSGKMESVFYDISEMPTPSFFQDLSLSSTGGAVGSGVNVASGSSADGSVIYAFIGSGGAALLYRFQRDAYTGQYLETHRIDPTIPLTSSDGGAIIQIGIYIYVFTNNGTNAICSRFLAADLTGEQAMTVPTVAETSHIIAWTDGTFAYLICSGTSTTSRKWSISGTTMSAVSTTTVSSVSDAQYTSMYDGTSAYICRVVAGQNNISISKLTAIDASSVSTTTKTLGIAISDVQSGSFVVNIDSQRMYIGFAYTNYNKSGAASAQSYNIRLIPITKP